MKQKDFQMGLNYIDEELIEEAALPAKPAAPAKGLGMRRYRKILTGLAAALVICIVGITGFHMTAGDSESDMGMTASTDTDYGEYYSAAENYGQVYDAIDNQITYGIQLAQPKGSEVSRDYGAEEINSAAGSSLMASNNDHSSTNVITEGADEGDIVKTDGKYIYLVDGSSVIISDVQGAKPKTVETLTIPFESPSDIISEIYVTDNKLLAIVNHYDGDKESTFCYVYDISDPENPELKGSMNQDGYYNTSRIINGQVYLLSNNYLLKPEFSKSEAVSKDKLNKWLPMVNDKLIPSGCFLIHENNSSALIISSFPIDNPGKTSDVRCILSDFANIYVSLDNLYIYEEDYITDRSVTDITSFRLDKGKIKAGSSTNLNGSITDAFAINEKDGYLRVLTTDMSHEPESNALFVLDEDLKLCGTISSIAKGEQIYAARYVGDLVYFITYKNVDPLFVADLSDPADPKLLGSLEVEGYSEYLHQWDDKHILGIGYDPGDPDSEEAGSNNLSLTMFDVTDATNPVVEDLKKIKGSYYSDAVDGDYKGILVSTEKGLIGFPAEKINDKVWQADTEYELFTYSDKEGFKVRSVTDLEYSPSSYRGVFCGDRVFVAGNGKIVECK